MKKKSLRKVLAMVLAVSAMAAGIAPSVYAKDGKEAGASGMGFGTRRVIAGTENPDITESENVILPHKGFCLPQYGTEEDNTKACSSDSELKGVDFADPDEEGSSADDREELAASVLQSAEECGNGAGSSAEINLPFADSEPPDLAGSEKKDGAAAGQLSADADTLVTFHFGNNPKGAQDKPERLHLNGSSRVYCVEDAKKFKAGTAEEIGMDAVRGWSEAKAKRAAAADYYVHNVNHFGLSAFMQDWAVQTLIWNISHDTNVSGNRAWPSDIGQQKMTEVEDGFYAWYSANADSCIAEYHFYRAAGTSSAAQAVASFSVRIISQTYGGVKVNKTDADTGADLAGAEFTIYIGDSPSGARARVLTTGADGTACTKTALTGKTIYTGNISSRFFGTDLSPIYDFEYYKNNNPDLAAAGLRTEEDYLSHFVTNVLEGDGTDHRQAVSTFNIDEYRSNYPDISAAMGNGDNATYALHFLQHGYREGRNGVRGTKVDDALRANDTALPEGTYTIAETKAPDGYGINFQPQTFTINSDGQVFSAEAKDRKRDVRIRIKKTSSNTAALANVNYSDLSGAVFEVYADETCRNLLGTLTTGRDGYTDYLSVQQGTTVCCREITPPKNYLPDTDENGNLRVHRIDTSSVTAGSDHTETMSDPPFEPSEFRITKIDKTTGKSKPYAGRDLAGTKFRVDYYAGNYTAIPELPDKSEKTWEVTIAKQKDGTYCGIIKEPLLLGTYVVTELQAGPGYTLNSTPVLRNVTETDGDTIHVAFINEGKPVSIRTTVKAESTDTNIAGPDNTLRIIDTVAYKNLVPGYRYTLKGKLMDKATGEELGIDGSASEVVFTPETENGTVDVQYTFSAEGFGNRSVVAFEYLYLDGTEIAHHADIEDEGQTVHIPKLGTTAYGTDTKTHTVPIAREAKVTDVVCYTNLVPGKKYTVTGTLHLKKSDGTDGGALKGADGKAVTSSVRFTPENADGSVELSFTVDATALRGKSYVVFEAMDYEGTKIAVHADISDEGQTINFPDIGTTAAVQSPDGSQVHEADAAEKTTISDKVSYKNLTPGDIYTLKGVLMDKSTGKPYKMADGRQVTAEKTLEIAKDGGTDGSTTMEFALDTSAAAGKSFVVFEYLYTDNGTEAATHENIGDAGQTITVIDIGTTAAARDTGINVTKVQEKATIIDTVSYIGLRPGKKYLVKGQLYDKETGKALDIEGAKAKAEFTPKKADGTVDLTYTINTKGLEGKSFVVFEDLCRDGVKIASHADIDDEGQTIHVPKVHTTAYGTDTKTKTARIGKDAQVTDVVCYTNLVPGKEYTVTGVLHLKNDDGTDGGELVDADGKTVTVTQKFTAEKADGSVELTFTVDSTALRGKSCVVFEDMGCEGVSIAVHADITDEDQTVNFPDVHTTATTLNGDGEQVTETQPDEETAIIDRVFFDNLSAGETYTVSGVLMDKENGKVFLDAAGNKVTAEATFTVSGKKTDDTVGTAERTGENAESVKDTVDPAAGEGKDSTARSAGTESGSTDSTKGTDNKKKHTETVEKVSEPEFTSGDGRSGYIDLEFKVKTSELAGKTFVVFEDLIHKDITVASHTDITDEGQTIRIIDLHTNAYGRETEAKDVQNDTEVTITDRVTYTNLIPGREYTVKGHLVDEEGRACTFEGAESERTFTPDEADGYVDVEFTFDAANLAGSTYVVFEDLCRDGKKIASHADIADEDQTFGIFSFSTMAVDETSDSKTMTLGTSEILKDTVTYKGLTPGRTYTLKGTVMDKNARSAVSGAEKTVTFTPDKADGTADIEFTINTSALAGKTLVIFENLYEGEKHIGAHEDYSDEDQTVAVPVPPTPTPALTPTHIPPVKTNRNAVRTGDTSNIALYITLIAAAAALILFIEKRSGGRRRK